MRRVDGWEMRLLDVVKVYEGAPFVYGATDCAQFAAACAHAITGEDFLQFGFSSHYSGRLSVSWRLKRRGYADITAAAHDAITRLGGVEISPRFARMGDIGATPDHILAVRLSPGFVARTINGQFGTVQAARAWRLG